MANTIATLANSGLVHIDAVINKTPPLSPESRGLFLKRLLGILYTSHNRPPTMVLFAECNLPQPSEIAIFNGDKSTYSDCQMAEDSKLGRVSAFVRRRLADDAYILHVHPTRSFYLVVTSGSRHSLLDEQLRIRHNDFISTPKFPQYLWTSQQRTEIPQYFEQLQAECIFYGSSWTVTLRLCEDGIVRPIRWDGISFSTPFKKKGMTIVGSKARPMLVVSQPVESGKAYTIRPLQNYENACESASPPADRF